MSMPRLRWPLLAALGLGLFPTPSLPVSPLASVQRLVLTPDSTFHLPDSVRALLTAATQVVVAPDSSVYLSDWSFPAIFHLERDGAFRRALGRAGAGPGEFHQVLRLGIYRDSLWAIDPGQVRMTLFPLQGTGVTTLPVGPYAPPSLLPGPIARRGIPFSIMPDGSLLFFENTPDPVRPGLGYLFRVDRSMRVIDTIAPISTRHTSMAFLHRDGELHATQPFGDDPLYSVSVTGSLVVLVDRTAATSEEEAEFTVTALRNGTEVAWTRNITYQPRRLTNRLVDSAVNRIGGPPPGSAARSPVTPDSVRRKLFRPAFLPPVEKVVVGRDGSTWLKVRFADGPNGADEWLQLSPRGFPLRRVTARAGLRILEADRQVVWGTYADSLDVPQVGRYPLESRQDD